MTENRSRAIIAVFGGSDTDAVRLAEEVGGLIARRGQILLTGGTRPGNASVKESAIAGVGSSPWVGVERAGAISCAERDNGFVIYSDIDHRRNYLEACLCDGAIGLKGGDGTISELVFSLALQRPVVLVGDHWQGHELLDLSTRPEALNSVVEQAFRRVGKLPSGRQDLDQLLNETAITEGLKQLPPFQYFPTAKAGEAVQWIVDAVRSRKAGNFLCLTGYESVVAAYQRWLRAACNAG